MGIRKLEVVVTNSWKIVDLISYIVLSVSIESRDSKAIAHGDIVLLQRSSCN